MQQMKKSKDTANSFSRIKWLLTAGSGILTTSLVVILES